MTNTNKSKVKELLSKIDKLNEKKDSLVKELTNEIGFTPTTLEEI